LTLWGRRSPVAYLRRLLARPRPAGPRRPVRAIGHRGAPRERAENTVAGFARAVELGADGIETDVCRTRDGVWVLWHDNLPESLVSLARDIGEDYPWEPVWREERRPIREMTLDEMRRACGYSQGVPFDVLDDLWRWAAGEPGLGHVYLDVKLEPEQAGRAPELLDAVVAAGWGGQLHLLLPQRELWPVLASRPRPADVHLVPDFELPGAAEEPPRRVSMGYTTRRTWSDFRRELALVVGRAEDVTVWTFDDEAKLRQLLALGVDAILTDDLPLLARLR
jgi:glycerophosphoryl diester phosphodiesterase